MTDYNGNELLASSHHEKPLHYIYLMWNISHRSEGCLLPQIVVDTDLCGFNLFIGNIHVCVISNFHVELYFYTIYIFLHLPQRCSRFPSWTWDLNRARSKLYSVSGLYFYFSCQSKRTCCQLWLCGVIGMVRFTDSQLCTGIKVHDVITPIFKKSAINRFFYIWK